MSTSPFLGRCLADWRNPPSDAIAARKAQLQAQQATARLQWKQSCQEQAQPTPPPEKQRSAMGGSLPAVSKRSREESATVPGVRASLSVCSDSSPRVRLNLSAMKRKADAPPEDNADDGHTPSSQRVEDDAATMLQAMVRGRQARCSVTRHLLAVVRMQRAARGQQQHRPAR